MSRGGQLEVPPLRKVQIHSLLPPDPERIGANHFKRGTPSHPKVLRLLQALNLCQKQTPTPVGLLELLLHFTAQFAPSGDVGRYGDPQIEAAVLWYGKRGRLVRELPSSGWVDVKDLYRLC